MDTSFCYNDLEPDTEGILCVMLDLTKKKCTDSTLLSNLNFAERVLRGHPLQNHSKLCVIGKCLGVQIGKSSLVFTVSSDTQHNTCLNLYIKCYFEINKGSINESHFFGHSCQDEVTSCFRQAKEAVLEDGVGRLMIKCNRFSITYATDLSSPQKTVETKCQFKLETITVEGLLERKLWLLKEKAPCQGLIACLDHLIKQYLTTPGAPKSHCRFIIHADDEIVNIVSSGKQFPVKEYVLLYDNTEISMFPPTW